MCRFKKLTVMKNRLVMRCRQAKAIWVLVKKQLAPITEDYTDELNDFDVRRLEALRVQA